MESLPINVVNVQYFHVDFIHPRLLSQHVLIKYEMVHVIVVVLLFRSNDSSIQFEEEEIKDLHIEWKKIHLYLYIHFVFFLYTY